MKLTSLESRMRAVAQGHAYLVTVSGDGKPHAVPVTFAGSHEQLAIGIDEKPKSTNDLKRLRNIRENSRVSLLWDHYDDDWTQLWWARADGKASIEERGALWEDAWAALNRKYQQYQGRRHEGPVILVEVTNWTGWAHG